MVEVHHEFWIPLTWPLSINRLIMQAYDANMLKKNELVGSLIFNLKKICKLAEADAKNGYWSWFNIYGSPPVKDILRNDNIELMNSHPERASTWKGRVLIQFECNPTVKPTRKEIHMEPQKKVNPENTEEVKVIARQKAIIEESKVHLIENEFYFIAEVGFGVNLPSGGPFRLKIKIGDFEQTTDLPSVQTATFN